MSLAILVVIFLAFLFMFAIVNFGDNIGNCMINLFKYFKGEDEDE